jgi:hypothetical protein
LSDDVFERSMRSHPIGMMHLLRPACYVALTRSADGGQRVAALSSWNDTAAKRSIEGFVTGATAPGDKCVEPADRIAVFDTDATMGIEQPLPVQRDVTRS